MVKMVFYTDRSIIDWVLEFRQQHRRWPRVRDLETTPDAPTVPTVWHRFGGLHALKDAAELVSGRLSPTELRRLEPQRQKLLNWLEDQVRNQGRRITPRVLQLDPTTPPLREFARCCGGLDAALKMLGLPMNRPSDEDLIEAIQNAAQELQRIPHKADALEGRCTYAPDMFRRRFTRWNLLLVAAGLEPDIDRSNWIEAMARKKALQANSSTKTTAVVILASTEAVEVSA